MKLPDMPRAGAPLNPTWGRQVVDYLRSITPHGPGVRRTANGAIIVSPPQSPGRRPQPEPKTFFVTAADDDGTTQVAISPGAINNIELGDDEQLLGVSDGDKVWLEVDVDEDGNVTEVHSGAGSSIPENTETEGYTLLATIAIVSGATQVTPLAWNYSQVQLCGQAGESTTYLWGGFGS